MTSDLIEKISADMHEAWKAQAEKEWAPKKAPILAEEDVPFADLSDYDKRHYRAEAQAALNVLLSTLKTPSDGMIEAMADAIWSGKTMGDNDNCYLPWREACREGLTAIATYLSSEKDGNDA